MKRKPMERCPICREWKIPRYDQATRKMSYEHACPKPQFEDLRRRPDPQAGGEGRAE